jgi:uncharacterized membrane protein (UPF0127 family)/antirestriction protein ArdC
MAGQALLAIKGRQWAVDIANNVWEQSQGLGGLSILPAGTGMLFDMGYQKIIEVTTVPMLFSLDIAFLSDALIVTEIYRNIEPGYLVTSQQPARYFIEVNAGELKDIETGDQVAVEVLSNTEVMQSPDWGTVMASFFGFIMMGALVVSLAKDVFGESIERPKELYRLEISQTEVDLLKPCRFPLRTQALNTLTGYDIVHVHDDGDLTVRSQGKLYVVTTEGKIFEQKMNYEYDSSPKAVCENVSPKYYDLLRWVGVPLPDYSFSIEPEVRERKIDEVLKRLKEGVNDIQESSRFKQFLITMSKFHDYSIGNMILIMVQKTDASRVAGFNTWKNLGRWVKKGEKGISILAPCFSPKKERPEPEEEKPEEEIEINPIFFKVVHVFDVSQTEGKPLPEFEVVSLTGEANEDLFRRAMDLVIKQGLEVSFESRPYQDPAIKGIYSGKSIWVRPEESRAQQLKTLLHEIAHHFSESVFRIPRRDAETIAESAAFTAGAHFGFDSGVRSFAYVALWAEDKKVLETNLTAIRKVSSTMIEALESLPVGELIKQ